MALLSKPGLIPVKIENQGNQITTQVNKINFTGSGVTASIGQFNDVIILINNGVTGGDVTQLIAGTNITLSPADGKGTVTINASTGGGGSGVPNGPNYSLQYNNGGLFSGSGNFTLLNNNALYLTGSLNLGGLLTISGSIIPAVSKSFSLGSAAFPFRDIFISSGSLVISSDIPGGVSAVISNADGNVSIAAAGLQLKSGSAIPFNITPAGLTTINTPNTLLTTEAAFSIIGSTTGYQQPRNFTGTLLQLTAQDNQSGRISIDSFGTGAYGLLAGRTARGTVNTPLQTKAGDTLFRISAQGWTNSNAYIGSIVRIDWEAAEDFTSTSAGNRLRFQTTPTGSTTIQTSAIIDTTGITIPSSSRFFGTASWASNAQTASYVNTLNQNIVITGSLSLSSGSALNINDGFFVNGNKQFNYGQFSSTVTQSGSANTAYPMTFDTIDFQVGVVLAPFPNNSRITVVNTGIYNIQFSTQLHTTANQFVDFSIWFAKNGLDIANSNTDFTIEKINGGGFLVAALNFLVQLQSNDYVELKYSKTTSQGQLQAKGPQINPTRPGTPSAIVTVTQIA
jgi:hypothetical protein